MHFSEALAIYSGVLLSDFLRYFIAAGTAYLLFWIILRKRWHHRIIQRKRPGRARMWSEFKYSMSTVVIFAMVGWCIVQAKQAGLTRIYAEIGERGWPWFFASILIMILLHDAYFYWAHRFMHHPRIFRHVHLVHHRSTNPSPWAAYAFHPLEALIEAAFFPLIVVAIPAHPIALLSFLVYMISRNVLGHLGIELFPRWFARSKWFNWHTTTTHHDLHHKGFDHNYGLYFTWWDRWMNTEHEQYVEIFEEVTSRPSSAESAASLLELKRKINPRLIALLLLIWAGSTTLDAQSVAGCWQTFDEDTGLPLAQIDIREEAGSIKGTITDLKLPPWLGPDPICSNCEGTRKDQRIIGMEIIWGFTEDGTVWRDGHILDPAGGDVYLSKMWLESASVLRVRGYTGPFNLFYRTQDWQLQDDGGDDHPLTGTWTTIDDESGRPTSHVEISLRNGRISGRIRELLQLPWEEDGPICRRCPDELKDTPIIGLTILTDFRREEDSRNSWVNGHILDPSSGKTYSGAVWLETSNTLKVRGYWGPFYRTQTWRRVRE